MRGRPTIAVTAGDPCGIGPEVILKAVGHPSLSSLARFVVIGDASVFAAAARRCRVKVPAWQPCDPSRPRPGPRGTSFIDLAHRQGFRPGHSSASAGQASLDYLECALRLWRQGRIDALVTAPVTKWAIQRVLPGFTGHTEWLARRLRAPRVVMMFASQRLRVVVLTRHLPLGRVPGALTPRLMASSIRVTSSALRGWFGVRAPRLAVCGVNPHAGEGGLMGGEERRVMIPVLRALRRSGIRCEGPFAADGFFAQPGGYDAVICAYHDQGLIPFKMAARDLGCQVTLGLPLVRTSPDHGSALDIAGRGRANAGSMVYALRLAAQLAARHADRV